MEGRSRNAIRHSHRWPGRGHRASGYIGAHTVIALLKRGYDVRACVTDRSNPDKTEFLLALNDEHPGCVTLHEANLLDEGSYDAPFADCSAVLHVGTIDVGGVTCSSW